MHTRQVTLIHCFMFIIVIFCFFVCVCNQIIPFFFLVAFAFSDPDFKWDNITAEETNNGEYLIIMHENYNLQI